MVLRWALILVLTATTGLPDASAKPRLAARVSSALRKAGIFVAPVRVQKGVDGSVHLVRWGISKKGRPVPKEHQVTFKDGSHRKSEVSYRVKNGKRVIQKETSHLGVTTVVDGNRTFTKKVVPEEGGKPLTATRAYLKAVGASPVVHFMGTTAFFYLFWEVAPRLVGVHLSPGQAATAALATKGLTLPLVTVNTLRELSLWMKRPRHISRRTWRLIKRHAHVVEQRDLAVSEARETLKDPALPEREHRAVVERLRHHSRQIKETRAQIGQLHPPPSGPQLSPDS